MSMTEEQRSYWDNVIVPYAKENRNPQGIVVLAADAEMRRLTERVAALERAIDKHHKGTRSHKPQYHALDAALYAVRDNREGKG